MKYIIAYDIKEKRRLSKVAKTMESFAFRVQYSVFIADLDEANLARLRSRLEKIIDDSEDSVLFFQVRNQELEHRIVYGPEFNAVAQVQQAFAVL